MAEQKTRLDVDKAIMVKSLRDEALRAALVADPKGTLEKELQALTGQEVKLPENVRVTVHEETPESIHLVIPAKVKAGAELDDAELAQVAGGTCDLTFQPQCLTVAPCVAPASAAPCFPG